MMVSREKLLEDELRSTQSELFLYKVRYTQYYGFIQELMKQYKNDRRRTNAISLFSKLARFIKKTDNKDLIELFNKCLVKEAIIPYTEDKDKCKKQCEELLTTSSQAEDLLKKVGGFFMKPQQVAPPLLQEQLNEQSFLMRLRAKPHFQSIMKITELYLKCIVNLKELRSLLEPFLSRGELAYLVENAQSIESHRRKGTVFVPLNQLSEDSFTHRIARSYVQMPACYAKKCNSPLIDNITRMVLNREWVSVPLGSQHVSFVVMRKNCYEEELFKNQDQKYQLDQTMISLRRALDILNNTEMQGKSHQNPLLKKILYSIYGTHEPYHLWLSKPQVVRVMKIRVEQKLNELQKIRQRLTKQWQEISNKNFHKSLDHRSFYFRKNEKKYNSISRWNEELEFRQSLYVGGVQQLDLKDGKDKFNDQIDMTVDTFENVTRHKCVLSKKINIAIEPASIPLHPKPPYNKVLFVMEFSDLQLLGDISMILNQYIPKKGLLQYLMLKLFNINLKKLLEKNSKSFKTGALQKLLETNKPEEATAEDDLLEKRERRKPADDNEQFEDLIEEQIPPIQLKDIPSPFEGPPGHTFTGTRTHYYFVRYLLAIYQRFLKAKQFFNEQNRKSEPLPYQSYDCFRSLLYYKVKDQKLEEYLRKIFSKNAYLFISLDKLILGATKQLSGCDQLSTNIIKQDTKDFQHQIRPIETYKPKSDYHQLLRLYHQNTIQFRFCLSKGIMYLSSWPSVYKGWQSQQITKVCNEKYEQLSIEPVRKIPHPSNFKQPKWKHCQYFSHPNQLLVQQAGEEFLARRTKFNTKSALMIELNRRNRLKL